MVSDDSDAGPTNEEGQGAAAAMQHSVQTVPDTLEEEEISQSILNHNHGSRRSIGFARLGRARVTNDEADNIEHGPAQSAVLVNFLPRFSIDRVKLNLPI